MNIFTTSGKTSTLSIIDPKSGVDYINDLIGNTNALSDGQFKYVYDTGAYHCSDDTLDWWVKAVDNHQALDNFVAELSAIHGYDNVIEAIGDAGNCDFEDQPYYITTRLQEVFNNGQKIN